MYHFIKKKSPSALQSKHNPQTRTKLNNQPRVPPTFLSDAASIPRGRRAGPEELGGEGVKGTQIMSFLILVLYMLRLQNPGDLNTAPKIFKDGVAPELMMLRTLEILHAGRELGLGLQVFSGRFFLWSQYP